MEKILLFTSKHEEISVAALRQILAFVVWNARARSIYANQTEQEHSSQGAEDAAPVTENSIANNAEHQRASETLSQHFRCKTNCGIC